MPDLTDVIIPVGNWSDVTCDIPNELFTVNSKAQELGGRLSEVALNSPTLRLVLNNKSLKEMAGVVEDKSVADPTGNRLTILFRALPWLRFVVDESIPTGHIKLLRVPDVHCV